MKVESAMDKVNELALITIFPASQTATHALENVVYCSAWGLGQKPSFRFGPKQNTKVPF